MPQDPIRNRKAGRSVLGRAALGAVVAVLVVCVNTAAVQAGDDDEDGASVMNRIMRTFGLKAPEGGYDGINYAERSPLVVPPTRDLPPPVNETAPPAPNWPKDPDVERRAKAKQEDKKVVPHKDDVVESSRPLRPDELSAGGGTTASNGSAAPTTGSSQQDDRYATPAKKNLFTDIFKKEEYATFTGEPARGSLTDPPPGYLTPSPDQPYGVGAEHQKYKVQTLGERMEPQSGSAASPGH